MWILGLFEVADWLILFATLLCATHLYLTWCPLYWRSRGVPGPPHYPFVGSTPTLVAAGMAKTTLEEYGRKKYGDVFGYTIADLHYLVVFKEDLLSEILVKNFNNFANPVTVDFMMGDEIADKFVSTLRGDDWRRVRNIITPSFSTGKLKMMMGSIRDTISVLDENIGKICDNDELVEVKDLFGAYVMDTLARTAFGVEINSQHEKDHEFVVCSKKAFKIDFADFMSLPMMIWQYIPWIMPFLGNMVKTSFVNKDSMKYFAELVDRIFASRSGQEKGRKDFMQLLMNAHKEEIDIETVAKETEELGGDYQHAKRKVEKGLTKQEIVAQGCTFLSAGYDTVAGTLSFLAYNLACYPECQERLYEELIDVYGEEVQQVAAQRSLEQARLYDDIEVAEKAVRGSPDYHSLHKSRYLNMCIDETLRLHPILLIMQRQCSGDTTVGGIPVKKGDAISIPVNVIHHDPEIYPDPEKFDPERFTEEAKAARSPFHYLPFGYGPRHCVGMRFALMEIKAAMIDIIRKYRFITCEKTEKPLEYVPSLLLKAKNGIWLKVERRSRAD